MRTRTWVAVGVAPLLLLARPTIDESWENHPAHFWPRFRVGVSSGEVLAGLVGAARGHRKHGVVGDVVNLAARLQAAAPVGSVLIGEETFRALGSRAIVEPNPPTAVKGRREPVRSHVLLGLVSEGEDREASVHSER